MKSGPTLHTETVNTLPTFYFISLTKTTRKQKSISLILDKMFFHDLSLSLCLSNDDGRAESQPYSE